MRRPVLVFAVAVTLSACVSAPMTPTREAAASFRQAYIVPMEPPPLEVPPNFDLVMHGSGGSIQAARGFALFNTLLILMQLPDASKRGGDSSQALQAALDGEGVWIPTVALANEVKAQLATAGKSAMLSPDVKRLPGIRDRSYTALLENWMAPIRAWYNDEKPTSEYVGRLPDQKEYVIEVGISNYSVFAGTLLLQVHMRVIDGSDGRLVGRARAANPFTAPTITPLERTFADDGSHFKEVFTAEGRKLVRECLSQLGVVQ